MSKSRVIRSDFSGLNKLVKAIDSRLVVKVGIFGNKTSRSGDKNITNAELGMVHEFGSKSQGIPPRSFLRMPLMFQGNRIVSEAGQGAETLLAEGQTVKLLQRLGHACEKAILRAFSTGGFGFWPRLKMRTMMRKKSHMPLIDTGQLRRSITSKVENP